MGPRTVHRRLNEPAFQNWGNAIIRWSAMGFEFSLKSLRHHTIDVSVSQGSGGAMGPIALSTFEAGSIVHASPSAEFFNPDFRQGPRTRLKPCSFFGGPLAVSKGQLLSRKEGRWY
jgi:hypothetical protein